MQNEEGRYGAATVEQIALADSIADRMYPRTHPGWIGGQACALRAIQMTTELAAKFVDTLCQEQASVVRATKGDDDRAADACWQLGNARNRLRAFDHLKGHPQ